MFPAWSRSLCGTDDRAGLVATWGLILGASLCFGLGLEQPNAPRWVFVALFVLVALTVYRWRPTQAHWWALALLAWLAFTLLWSPDQGQGAVQLQHLGLGFLVFAHSFHVKQWIRPAYTVAYGGVLLMGFLLPHAAYGNENFVTEWLLIAAPLVLPRWRLFLWPIAASYLVFWNESRLELFLIGLAAVAGLILYMKRGVWQALAGGILLGLLIYAVVDPGWFDKSLGARLEAIINTGFLVGYSPLWGSGLGSFDYLYPMVQQQHLTIFPELGTVLKATRYMGAAHNEPLQLVMEGGLFALLLAFLFLASLRGKEGVYWAVLAMAGALSLLEFPLQNTATALPVALSLGVLAGEGREVRLPKPLLTALATVLLWHSLVLYQAYYWLGKSDLHAASGRVVNGFIYALKAYETHSGPLRMRLNLPGLLMRASASGRLRVTASVAETMFAIGASASPWHPTVLINRVDYLVAARQNPHEARRIVAYLEEAAPHLKETAVIAAKWRRHEQKHLDASALRIDGDRQRQQ